MDRLANLWTHLSPYGPEYQSLTNEVGTLKGKTVLVSGASRGIGEAIAKRCAMDGANVILLAKTDIPHPKLPGTIYSAAEEIREASKGTGARVLPLRVDIRDEAEVKSAIEKAVALFGGLDIVVCNASSLNLVKTEECTMKQ
jgi:citronellol/citronellal dehydrogenase